MRTRVPPGVFPKGCEGPSEGARWGALGAKALVNAAGVSHAGLMAERDVPPASAPNRGETSRERLDAAFAATPRAAFLPEEVRDLWRENRPLPLAHGMTNSQPSTVRDMLSLLDMPPAQARSRVLDVGSGSGWATALLAHLVGPGGSVLGLEIEPDLVAFGRARLAEFKARARCGQGTPTDAGGGREASRVAPLPIEQVQIEQAPIEQARVERVRIEQAVPGVLGAPQEAPFDRILVSAMATTLPQALVAQLAPGGLLVVPVDGRMVRVRLRAPESPLVERFGGYRFVPLR